MEKGNRSTVTKFFLSGLTDQPELQLPLFLLFLGIYLLTVLGNLGMIILILLSSNLQTPMYFFLSSLSFIDLCQSTVITPKMLMIFLMAKNDISYTECIIQLYFFVIFVVSECYMLAAMAYDRYVAICNPLLYSIIMSQHKCLSLVLGVYILGLVCASAHVGCIFRVDFCKSDLINHYFCDLISILKLSCSNIFVNELVILIFSLMNTIFPTLTIIISYVFIIISILRIKSTEGRSKAFSTCSSHISAVAIFFGSAAFMYLKPSSSSSIDEGKTCSIFYTIFVPMLNPLIYSLRNKDVNIALKKILERRSFF
ncbi:olfactory receptor 146-like [Rattus rattus]|uniref:olfactory receptor 146-like n=1 Tax=Rattus rattus TaxID=10117 RepID=UPI0013F2EA3D|nr:olfactory receptor 146-like [Rattus rattus]